MSARLRPLQRAASALLQTSRPALQRPPPRRHLPAFSFSSATPRSARNSPTSGPEVPRIVHGDDTARTLTLELPNGQQTSFHYLWLRDHCREPRSYHPATKQRLVDTFLIPADLEPSAVMSSTEGLTITWPEREGSGDSYESFFPWSFLLEHSYAPALRKGLEEPDKKVLWTSEISKDLPTVSYEEVMESEKGVYEWVKRIGIYGFSMISGIPPTPEATEQLIRRIAFIRETHYGGFWDFTADLKHGDLAYSDVLLQGHTDTTYFTDPCGLQLFHLLSPDSSHKGGHNLLVDGFRAASIFKQTHPDLYELFSTLPVPSHASGTGSESSPSGVYMAPLVPKPVFNHEQNGELVQVRWNGDDRGVVGGPAWEGKMEEWFEGVRAWEGILRSKEATLWSKMEMGTAVIFDNHRVLHGRSSFTGERRLCGAYINHDDFRSRLKGLEKQFGEKGQERERLLSKYGLKSSSQSEVWAEYA